MADELMSNKYLEKIAGLKMPAFKPKGVTSKANRIIGAPAGVSAGGSKGSVFGKAPIKN